VSVIDGGRGAGRRSRRVPATVMGCAAAALAGWLLWPVSQPEVEPELPVASLDPRLPPLPFGSGPPVPGPDRAADEPSPAGPPRLAQGAAEPRMDYGAAVRRFYGLLWFDPNNAELRALAPALDRDLAAAMAGGEVDGDDALLLKADLLDLLEHSPTRRGAALAQWREQHLVHSGVPGPDPRNDADRRREAAIVAQWQALPSEERDAGELEEALEVSRKPGRTP
jgi:hypothetical protein